MKIITSISELREVLKPYRQQGKTIGFVPTMGNLHCGHISLVHTSCEQADVTVASIFVNPLQFGENEDLDNYPKTLERDSNLLEANGCDLLFAPTVKEMYPNGKGIETLVDLPELSSIHCGSSRPGHFRGVATVVTKLFGIVQPDVAVFGKKDFQQLAVIRRMTEDLSLPVEIVGVETARNEHGLALSSRNGYLNDEQLQTAINLSKTINWAKDEIISGNRDYKMIEERANCKLEEAGFERDYFHICDQKDLLQATKDQKNLVILAAAQMGPARLIDNNAFTLD